MGNERAVLVGGILAFKLWKHLAKSCGELDERFVLLRGEIVLGKLLVLNCSNDRFIAGWLQDDVA